MYKELDKYKTGKKVKSKLDILGTYATMTISEDEYVAPLGSLIDDFVSHKKKQFWKKKYYHNHLTDIYIKFLNQVSLVATF